MRDFMLDLETMDTRPSAAIVAIGCVAFDLEDRKIGAEFYRTVDLGTSVAEGGTLDADTIMWWLRQSDPARDRLSVDPQPIQLALADFSHFVLSQVQDKGDVRMWGNGADFDNVILGNAFRRIDRSPPWTFRNNRCYRTVRAAHPTVLNMPRNGVHHNALDDAAWQANMLIQMIGGRRYEP